MASQSNPATPVSPQRNSLPSIFSITAAKRLSKSLRKPNKSRKSSLPSTVNATAAPDAGVGTKTLPSKAISNVIELPPARQYRSISEILSSPRKSIASIFPTRTPHINSLVFTSPHIATLSTADGIEEPLPRTDSTPDGFVLGGDLLLFGSGIPAKIYKLLGTARHGSIKEFVRLEGDAGLKELLPGFAGEVTLADVTLVYQTEIAGQEAGVWLQASARFEGALEKVGSVVRAVFGIETVQAEMRAYLGKETDWRKPLRPKRFCLRSVLGGETQVHRRICFTRIGVDITADRGGKRASYDVAVRLFGQLVLTLPGSGQHLNMEWTMEEEIPGVWTLRVDKCKEEVVDMVGFKGLKVRV